MEESLNRPIDRLLAYLAGNEEMIDVAHGLLAAFDAAEELASKVDLPPGFHTGIAAQMAKSEALVLGLEQEEAGSGGKWRGRRQRRVSLRSISRVLGGVRAADLVLHGRTSARLRLEGAAHEA